MLFTKVFLVWGVMKMSCSTVSHHREAQSRVQVFVFFSLRVKTRTWWKNFHFLLSQNHRVKTENFPTSWSPASRLKLQRRDRNIQTVRQSNLLFWACVTHMFLNVASGFWLWWCSSDGAGPGLQPGGWDPPRGHRISLRGHDHRGFRMWLNVTLRDWKWFIVT